MADAHTLQRRAIADGLFVAERIFARLGREGAASMARAQLMDLLDRPLVDTRATASRVVRAMQLARDAGRAFRDAERNGDL